MALEPFPTHKDQAHWLLLPSVILALSSITLLAPHRAALAASTAPAASKPAAPVYDDGDGDELLEHWGDPKYVREQRLQDAGMAVGFFLLAGVAYGKRLRRREEGLR